MIVVADTTPLRYLVVIEREHLLPALYGRVIIPPAVAQELNHESTPDVVRAWIGTRPSWLEIRQPICFWWMNGMLVSKQNAGTCAWSARYVSLPTAPAASPTLQSLLSDCGTRTFAPV